jgi:Ca2+-binding EF-hand superfamily protein
VIAARLGVSDLERFGATFIRLDKDGDGMIMRAELEEALNDSQEGVSVNVDAVLEAADLDHTGGIGFTEFVAACLYARHATKGTRSKHQHLMEQAFRALDDDRDGYVTFDQVRMLFRERDAPSFRWLPQDRPFLIDEWCSCLRAVESSRGAARPSFVALEAPIVPPQLVSQELDKLDFSRVTIR